MMCDVPSIWLRRRRLPLLLLVLQQSLSLVFLFCESASLDDAVVKALIAAACQHSPYPEVCSDELSGVPATSISSPADLVSHAILAASDRCSQGRSLAATYSAQPRLPGQCSAVCVELMDDARLQLDLASSRLSSLDPATLASPTALRSSLLDATVWLSSALSYQTACTDTFDFVSSGSVHDQITSQQAYLGQVVGNALSLVEFLSRAGNDLSSWYSSASPPPPPFPTRRRLLGLHTSAGGFPSWVSPGERRLLQASDVSPNAVVAQDGSGNFATVSDAVAAIPSSYSGRYVIYIKAGVYNEVFNITSGQQNVMFVGDGIGNTIITGDRNVASGDYNTYRTATVGVSGSGFFARDLTFRNTAGASGHQAVALRAGADFLVFYRCSFEGYQDTLYALSSRQFYRDCRIYGTVDFIFGNAIAVFQNCVLLARLPLQGQQNTYTAQGRQLESDISGYVFQNCTVTGDAATLQDAPYAVSTYLGRPWKAYSRVVVMESEIQGLVDPAGWLRWNASNPFTDTLYYGEYDNRGGGAGTAGRVDWAGVHPNMTEAEANDFAVANFIVGDTWLDAYQVPYQASL